jgi:hypothetical protein
MGHEIWRGVLEAFRLGFFWWFLGGFKSGMDLEGSVCRGGRLWSGLFWGGVMYGYLYVKLNLADGVQKQGTISICCG